MAMIFEPGNDGGWGANGTLSNGEAAYFAIEPNADPCLPGRWLAAAFVEDREYTIATATVDGAMLACRLATREGFAAWAAGGDTAWTPADRGETISDLPICRYCHAAPAMAHTIGCAACENRPCDDCDDYTITPGTVPASHNLCNRCYGERVAEG